MAKHSNNKKEKIERIFTFLISSKNFPPIYFVIIHLINNWKSRKKPQVVENSKLTPLKAIRKKCIWCMNDQAYQIRFCTCKDSCTLYPYRLGSVPNPKPALTVLKAIRENCYNCAEFSYEDRQNCDFKEECPLWPYHLGHNPKRKGIGNENIKLLKYIKPHQNISSQ